MSMDIHLNDLDNMDYPIRHASLMSLALVLFSLWLFTGYYELEAKRLPGFLTAAVTLCIAVILCVVSMEVSSPDRALARGSRLIAWALLLIMAILQIFLLFQLFIIPRHRSVDMSRSVES